MPRKPKGLPSTTEQPPPPGGFQDLCGNCRRPLEPDGRCADCGGWPYCVWLVDRSTGARLKFESGGPAWDAPPPPRACPSCAGKVGTNGMCETCPWQVAEALVHPEEPGGQRGLWTVSDEAGPWPRAPFTREDAKVPIHGILSMLSRKVRMPEDRREAIDHARERFLTEPDTSVPF